MPTEGKRSRARRPRRRRSSATSVYSGAFGPEQAERLLWRAGFGPRPGEAQALAEKGLHGAVRSLLDPPAARLDGPAPHDQKGRSIAPSDAWGHDHLWWLDRMVRSNQPLVERMALNWHDWFATGEVGSRRQLGVNQNKLLRRHALGRFDRLLSDITRDPAMLIWLSGTENNKWAPNENFARELMELFTLGAGRGYTERDVREQARALTGFRTDWKEGAGPQNFRFDPGFHDAGVKRVFGKRGRFGWRDAVRMCVEHRSHPTFFVQRLWSYFVPTPPSAATLSALRRRYVDGGYAIKPVVEAILLHPDLHEGPRMVKPPVVYIAGLLRLQGRGVDTEAWTWIAQLSGQMLFKPPNVAGWDETRWLDTATYRGRWQVATQLMKDAQLDPKDTVWDATEDSTAAVGRALEFWGGPSISKETRTELHRFAIRAEDAADKPWQQVPYRVLRQNALRMLVATSPDLQTS